MEYLNLANSNTHGVTRDVDAIEGDSQAKVYLRNVHSRLLVWLFGAITSELFTDITKVTAGRLRPHFISVCNPIIVDKISKEEKNLTAYCSTPQNPYEYTTNYYCSGNPSKIRDTRLSFLSGHSSYSAYSATFAVFYIQQAVDIRKVGLLKPALQILIASAALYTGLTRVSDYKHHWQDVLAGLFLGTLVASLVTLYVWPPLCKTYSRIFRCPDQRTESGQAGEELNQFSY